MSLFRLTASCALVGASLLAPAQESEAGQAPPPARTGRQVYEQVCITCHGPDGRAGVNLELEKIKKPPDFTDCSFANREPDRGFLAVAHNGGPARGFSALMAPWGGTFSEEEIGLAVGHIRTFCKDDRWPRGELNLPLALVTGKAFPEDEAVMKVTSKSGERRDQGRLRAALRPAQPVGDRPADHVAGSRGLRRGHRRRRYRARL